MDLNTIALGEGADIRFLDHIKGFVTDAVAELKSAGLNVKQFRAERAPAAVIGLCPACGKAVRENRKAFSCEDRGCEFVIFKRIAGKTISAKMAANLLQYRKSGPFKGFVSKKKKRFSASLLIVNEEGKWKVSFDFNSPAKGGAGNGSVGPEPRPGLPPVERFGAAPPAPGSIPAPQKESPQAAGEMHCPLCKGTIIEGKRGFGCSNWRPEHGDCRFVIWKEIAGKSLTRKNVETLVAGKKTRPYVLKDSNGDKFRASLKMVETPGQGFAIEVESKGPGFKVFCLR
jgi:DNA topoisomerase-3